MKRLHYILAIILLSCHAIAADGWDILNKSMDPWDGNGGAPYNQAWKSTQKGDGITITQQAGYVNITKSNTGANNYAYLIPAGLTLAKNTAYSFEIKARVQAIDKSKYPDTEAGYECNQLSARFHQKNMYLYLKHGDDGNGGYVSTTAALTHNDNEKYPLNTADWHVYRFAFHADNTKYDVYIDQEAEPVFKDIPVIPSTGVTNVIRLGAETNNRCNLDIAYVRMGTGLLYTAPKIMSLSLSANHHAANRAANITVTANTLLIENGKKLQCALVDTEGKAVAATECTVTDDLATGTLAIAAGTPVGSYTIKMSVEGGNIDGTPVAEATAPYTIVETLADYWDIIDKNMSAWDVDEGDGLDKAWVITRSGEFSIDNVTKHDGYANIYKTPTGGTTNYAFLATKELTVKPNADYTIQVRARTQAIDKAQYPDTYEGFESNAISARINNAEFEIHLKHGDADNGYVTLTGALEHPEQDKHKLNTADWHNYWFVFYSNNTFDVYIDDTEEAVWENVPAKPASGSNIIKLGAAKEHRCNMDIEYVKMKNGISAATPKIISLATGIDCYPEGKAHTVEATAQTILLDDGVKLAFLMTDASGKEIATLGTAPLQSGQAVKTLQIPALDAGRYYITATVVDDETVTTDVKRKSAQYDIVGPSPVSGQFFPQMEPVGFVKDINAYQYIGPSKEFITPCLIDTKPYLADGKFQDGTMPYDRYYLFHSPHENPGGIYLMTAPSLNGPWTERNTVIDLAWAKKHTESVMSKADHISACNVIWNDVYGKWFMYFHGPNTTTHYAISDNLKDWTFGTSILNPQSFGSPGTEASYAKIYEHAIPGTDNKYIMILMINEGGTRKVFWAHSKDGIDWTCNKKPLVSPDLSYKKIPGTDIKPDYRGGFGNNVAPALFMESNGRYFVFIGASSGNIYLVEVGAALDMEVHWGEYMNHETVTIDTNENGQKVAVPRISSLSFIQDDNGTWYMFFEAGGRLGANTAYAIEAGKTGITPVADGKHQTVAVYPTMLRAGETLTLQAETGTITQVDAFDMTGCPVSSFRPNSTACKTNAPAVAGLYLLKIHMDNGTTAEQKIVVTE